MSRKRQRETGVAVSLFPFLAVLICTMGVLIVMLVLAVSSSASKAQEANLERLEELQKEREVLLDSLDLEQFRVESLANMRPNLKRRLEEEKLRRSHLDEEIRRLNEETRVLESQFQGLVSNDSGTSETREQDEKRIAELRRKIEKKRSDLKLARTNKGEQPVLYSIVPTRTSGGTERRPIYVECTPSGIQLQPSGITIGLDDFTKPILPGNPLDVALLTTREHWNKFDTAGTQGEPYPLIVVRPGGATAYAVARRAMTSWDDEFGYELVEKEKRLNWGEPDSNLASSLRQAISISKQRQLQQVEAGLATWFNTGPNRVGSLGGQPLSGSSRNEGFSQRGQSQRNRYQNNSGNGSAGSNAQMQSTSEFGKSGQGSDGRFQSEGSFASNVSKSAGLDTTKKDSLTRFAGSQRGSQGQRGNTASKNSQQRGMGSPGQGGGEGNMASAFSKDPASLSAQSQQTTPLANERGENWALPTRTPGATPYRRPIRVDCRKDHYLIHNSQVDRASIRIAITNSVDVAIDELVNEVWGQIEGWGMAEIGGYWKPVLRLNTNDIQGAAKADELARKLESSGIEIERQWR